MVLVIKSMNPSRGIHHLSSSEYNSMIKLGSIMMALMPHAVTRAWDKNRWIFRRQADKESQLGHLRFQL